MRHLVWWFATSATACTWIPLGVCGNGLAEDGEACDDGNTVQTDRCTNACKRARCGDGFVWMGQEACDDGAMNSDTGACGLDCELNEEE